MVFGGDDVLLLKKKKLITWGTVILVVVVVFNIFCYERDKNDVGRNIEALKSSNAEVRSKAVRNLIKIGKPAVTPLIFAMKYGTVHATSDAVNSLTTIIKNKEYQKLASNTMTESKNLKKGAARVLGDIGDTRAIDPLISLLKYPDNQVVAEASNALAKIGKPAVDPLIRNFDLNYDGFARTLGKIGDERAVDVLIKTFAHKYHGIERGAEIEALAAIGMPAAKKLIWIIRSKDQRFEMAPVIESLSAMNSREVEDLIVGNLIEENNLSLLEALENIKSPTALLSLLEMLDSFNPSVREKGEFLLYNVKSVQAFKNLINIKVTRERENLSRSGKDGPEISDIDSAVLKKTENMMIADSLENRHYAYHYYFDALIELFNEGEPEVKQEVLRLLSNENWGDIKGCSKELFIDYRKKLFSSMRDENPFIRKAAIISLECGDPVYTANLIENLRDICSEIRLIAAQNIVRIRDFNALDIILKSLVDRGATENLSSEDISRFRNSSLETEKLIGQFEDGNTARRLELVVMLGFIGGEKPVEALIGALKDDNPAVVKESAHALAYLNDRRAVVPLCDALKTQDKSVKCEIICALGMLHDKRAVEPLSEILKGEDEDMKILAIRALGLIRDKSAVLPICGSLKDYREEVSVPATEILGDLGDKRAVPYLINDVYHQDEKKEIRVIRSLGKLKDRRAAALLNESLVSRSYPIRKESIKALRNAWDKNSVKLLGKLLTDSKYYDNETVMVCETLSAIYDPLVVDVFLNALKHKDEKISRLAVVALGSHKEKRVVKALLKLLKPGGENVDEIVVSLGKLKDPEAVVPLIEMFDGGQEIDGEIITALAGMGEPSVKELKKALRNKNRLVQDGARRTLDRMGIMGD